MLKFLMHTHQQPICNKDALCNKFPPTSTSNQPKVISISNHHIGSSSKSSNEYSDITAKERFKIYILMTWRAVQQFCTKIVHVNSAASWSVEVMLADNL